MSANFEQKNTGDIQTKDTTNIQITDQEKTHRQFNQQTVHRPGD